MSGKKNDSEQPKTILDWIADHDPALAGAIGSVNLQTVLEPHAGHGVTFLFPEDEKIRGELLDMADEPGAVKFIKLFNSFVIPDIFKKLNEFHQEGRQVGNLLGATIKVNCEGGVSLSHAPDFTNTDRLAVYIMAGENRPPTTGGGYKKPPPRKAHMRGGMAHHSAYGTRAAFADNVEGEFNRCMAKDGCRSHNPYLEKVVSLLNFLKVRHNVIYQRALFVIDYEPVSTFFILMEPYKDPRSGEYFIPEHVLFGADGWGGAFLCQNAIEEYMAFFEETAKSSDAIARQVDKIRTRIMGNADPSQSVLAVQAAYNEFESQNSIQGYPLPAAARQPTRGRKHWQDELRFVVHEALREVRAPPRYDSTTFRKITDELRYTRAGNNYSDELTLNHCSRSVYPKAEYMFVASFINSTDFLYTPCPPANISRWGPPRAAPLGVAAVYNRNASAFATLKGTTGMVYPLGFSPKDLAQQEIRSQLYGKRDKTPADPSGARA